MSAIVIAGAAAAAMAAPPAHAAGMTSCGSSLLDAAGDGQVYPVPRSGDLAQDAPYMDITEAFFTVRDGQLQANIRVSDLQKIDDTVDYPHFRTWAIDFYVGEEHYRASTRIYDGEWAFEVWHFVDGSASPEATGGSLVEGKDGTFTIDIPDGFVEGFEPGMTFTDVLAFSRDDAAFGAPLNAYSDVAPEEGSTTLDASVCQASAEPPADVPAPPADIAQAPSDAAPAPAVTAAPAPASAPAPAPSTAAPRAVAKKKAASKKCATKKSKKARKSAAACKKAAKKSKRRAKRR